MKRVVALLSAFAFAVGAAPPHARPPHAPAYQYKVVPVPNGGTIAGRITYHGTPPPKKQINPLVDSQVCAQHGLISPQDLVVASNGGIQYAVVRLTNIEAGRPATDIPPTTMLQQGCMFEPHVFAVAIGTPVKERNTDGVLHNVHTHSTRNPSVNFAHVPSVPEMTMATFSAPESIKVGCDVHNWMSAWIWVSPHPYIAVTAADGSYKITGVPPGQYHLEIWHETLGHVLRDVTVEAGKESRVDETFPLAQPTSAGKK